ncbi:hypothetical protein DBV15_11889, partial [Temnothorax longispinosus]
MDPNIMLMIIMKFLIQARDEPMRHAEITMKKVTAMYYLYLRYKKLEEQKNRRIWVRPIFTEERRLAQGDSNNLLVEMQLTDPEKYFNYLRMSSTIFNELLKIVGPLIEKQTAVRKPIPARTRLEMTIRWLASGDSMMSLSYAYRIAQCTLSHIIPETCEAIWLSLQKKVMVDPTEENWSRIAEDFELICQFPHCIGAIDGKHVEIQAPPRSGSCYYNYKGRHSINLLAVSDAKNRFIIVDIGAEGRQSDGEGHVARWLERLQQFEFSVVHRKGFSHKNADGLSRRLCEMENCQYCAKVERKSSQGQEKTVARISLDTGSLELWRKEQRLDPDISLILQAKKLVVPRSQVARILEEAHDSSSGGYFGMNKTPTKRSPSGKGKSPLQIYNVGTHFQRVQMDILGPLPRTSAGNKYLLVIVDCFTKWVEAFPVRNIRTRTIAEVFVNEIISRHGVPSEIHTDQGRNFESKLFWGLMNLLGIKKTRTTPLHPQSDGQVKRQHQTITNFLAKFVSENQKGWDRDLRLPLDLLQGNSSGIQEQESSGNYVQDLRKRLGRIHFEARERMSLRSSKTKTWRRGRAPKLQSNWEGPYSIVRKLSDVVFCIHRSPRNRKKIVHADRLAPFVERHLVTREGGKKEMPEAATDEKRLRLLRRSSGPSPPSNFAFFSFKEDSPFFKKDRLSRGFRSVVFRGIMGKCQGGGLGNPLDKGSTVVTSSLTLPEKGRKKAASLEEPSAQVSRQKRSTGGGLVIDLPDEDAAWARKKKHRGIEVPEEQLQTASLIVGTTIWKRESSVACCGRPVCSPTTRVSCRVERPLGVDRSTVKSTEIHVKVIEATVAGELVIKNKSPVRFLLDSSHGGRVSP